MSWQHSDKAILFHAVPITASLYCASVPTAAYICAIDIDPVSRMAFLKPVSLPQAGGSMSFEGWGASAETSFQIAKHVKTSTKAVTGTVSMRYISEKIDMISPADKSQQVT